MANEIKYPFYLTFLSKTSEERGLESFTLKTKQDILFSGDKRVRTYYFFLGSYYLTSFYFF